jgi:hypothetical protein
MSQIFTSENGSSAANVETLTGNSGGAVGPDAAFNINIVGANGVNVVGTPVNNTLTISVQNGTTSTGQTVNVQTIDLTTIDCSTAGTYMIESRIAAYTAGNNGAGFSLFTTVISTGAAVSVLDDTDSISHISPALNTADLNYEFIASGTNAILRITGVAGQTINWGAFSVYVFRGV